MSLKSIKTTAGFWDNAVNFLYLSFINSVKLILLLVFCHKWRSRNFTQIFISTTGTKYRAFHIININTVESFQFSDNRFSGMEIISQYWKFYSNVPQPKIFTICTVLSNDEEVFRGLPSP